MIMLVKGSNTVHEEPACNIGSLKDISARHLHGNTLQVEPVDNNCSFKNRVCHSCLYRIFCCNMKR
jgi:hypothetical protein